MKITSTIASPTALGGSPVQTAKNKSQSPSPSASPAYEITLSDEGKSRDAKHIQNILRITDPIEQVGKGNQDGATALSQKLQDAQDASTKELLEKYRNLSTKNRANDYRTRLPIMMTEPWQSSFR